MGRVNMNDAPFSNSEFEEPEANPFDADLGDADNVESLLSQFAAEELSRDRLAADGFANAARDFSERHKGAEFTAEKEFAAEAEMVLRADDLPFVRPALLREFVSNVEAADRRRDQIRRLPIKITVMCLAFLAVLGPGQPIAKTVATNVPMAQGNLKFLSSGKIQPALILSASKTGDSWAMVKAYESDRIHRSQSLLQGLGQSKLK
jgi:hypothetical protein